ncbi:hypothetical protein QN362_01670 [Actimicrobium sp. CCC2.4]|uniref:hypothetical protein n=1 Tax=Actimicrobium sp. CCC2.4 TaxID=3048606 RepID=UPI002AC8CC72|nr:hypothetical protein [Actimicrobium sp. CCC2.4]MEB0134032.1 hypothetical protein [Actimicrobium sp. CCC2.4]WPX31566.1 hypothetical protein RHM62_15150 [Actimicrobium sp. CCC2.4]
MATLIVHHTIRILTLDSEEALSGQGREGDIVLQELADGWWVHFIGEDSVIDSYDAPFASYRQALGTARAAAEFSAE